MENLPTTIKHAPIKPDEDVNEYLNRRLVLDLEFYRNIISRVNWLLERIHVTTETSGVYDKEGTRFMVVEFIPPGATKNDNGNWRLRIVEDTVNSTWDLEVEMKRSGTWVSTKIYHG